MHSTVKKYFIPHAANNYHPHVLHKKRALLYGVLAVSIKFIVIGFVLSIPLSAYMAPDVLKDQAEKIISLVNTLRTQKNIKALEILPALLSSSQAKADDMGRNHYFSHQGPDGKTVASWVLKFGYDYEFAGENLAMGFNAPKEVVDAWEKSPTHYANLIDKDFTNTGIGIKSGEYDGITTTFVAMHFGSPHVSTNEKNESLPVTKKTIVPTSSVSLSANHSISAKNTPREVAGVRVGKEEEPLVFDRASSRVYWKGVQNDTALSVQARITGSVQSARVVVGSYPIDLKQDGGDLYTGTVTIPGSPDNLFRPVVMLPAIKIVGRGGETLEDTIDWKTIKILNPPPLKKYTFAKNVSGPATELFSLAGWLYRGLIVFFGIALALCIFIEYKKQLPFVIIQTLILIGLFSFLLWV